MEIIQGVKILTLFKQHYLNQYPESLKCDYTCWGYYDGMDIVDVNAGESQLFVKKSNAAISDIWYQIAKKVSEIDGKQSQQNIGIFRKNDDKEYDFWDESKRKIFLSVCFVQLKEWKQSKKVADELEAASDSNVDILVYNTFDNADLVVFFQSNSYAEVLKRIKHLEIGDEFAYIHSINGVLEKSLKSACENGGVITDSSGNLLVNDKVCEVQIDIVATEKDFEKKLWSLFVWWNNKFPLKNYENILYSYVSGHGNYTFSWENTDMQSVLYLFLPDGIGTHRSGLFGKTIYNMETQIHLERQQIELDTSFVEKSVMEAKAKREEDKSANSWCHAQIEIYKEYMVNSWNEQDEGFYSYCRSMIQTLNMLAQFEKFELSNRIFCIIYPAFRLFSEQLREAYNIQKNKEKIKETIKEFSEAVNTIVYHAIHTDQMFLMIPGYSGTSFSIPTKLSLFYLWYLEQISKILNDDNYKYQFFLTPVMETRTYTNTVDFGLPVGDRLISVKVSQRSLYMPRMLLIILAHETAHYVGRVFRNRKERLKCIIRTMAYIIVEGIYPHYQLESKAERIRYKELVCYITRRINDHLKSYLKEISDDEKYHASHIIRLLKTACLTIIADENMEISKFLRKEIEKPELISERIRKIEVIQRKAEMADKRRTQLLGERAFTEIIDSLVRLYQEIFSDVVAKEILKFDKEDYETAFDISVGCKITRITTFDRIRKKVVMNTFGESADIKMPLEKGQCKSVIEYWTDLDVVEVYMNEYVQQCVNDLRQHFRDVDNISKMLQEIRNIMKIFSGKEKTWEEIYSIIIEKAGEYSENVSSQF